MKSITTALLGLLLVAGCAAPPPAADWERRLDGDAVVLLGEIHDSPDLQRLRTEALGRALQRGWRPAIAMEQFDIDRQTDIDRARRERPGDVDHVIAAAVPDRSGWDWTFYRPLVALALRHDLPLYAANLPNAATSRIVREGEDHVFDADRRAALHLDRAIDPAWQAAQQQEIAAGHCGMLPDRFLPAMTRAQLARDAVMAEVLRRHADHGIVLLAGNGHARRDLGVPRWLDGVAPRRVVAIGFLERPVATANDAFDAVVTADPVARPDPCAAFKPMK